MHRLTSSRLTGVVTAALGLVMMGYGIQRGEMATVLTKAIRICLECIGIG
ncbi:MAG: CD1871A family CXXC motif-containing protein [Ruminococcus sp.]|nr:CD1871A family CXXC motif-containing protein [Ruminococcus sp.]